MSETDVINFSAMNKRIRIIIGILMITIMAVGLSACGTDKKSPEGAVKSFLKNLQKGDAVVWQEELSGRKLSEEEKKELKKRTKADDDEQFKHIKDFDYKILNSKETKKGKEADVVVEFETYDFVKSADVLQKYFVENQEKLSKMKEKELKETINKEMKKQFDKDKKNIKNKATLHTKFDKKKKEWKVVDLETNFDFQNAITGGLLKNQIEQAQKLQEQNHE